MEGSGTQNHSKRQGYSPHRSVLRRFSGKPLPWLMKRSLYCNDFLLESSYIWLDDFSLYKYLVTGPYLYIYIWPTGIFNSHFQNLRAVQFSEGSGLNSPCKTTRSRFPCLLTCWIFYLPTRYIWIHLFNDSSDLKVLHEILTFIHFR